MSSSQPDYDVIIAGGGMVGVSLACAFARASKAAKESNPALTELSILLVDGFPLKPSSSLQYHPSFDARATALSMASIQIYQELGLLDKLMEHAEPIKTIHVSDSGHSGSSNMVAADEDMEAFGYVIENQWLGSVLLDALGQFSSIELLGNSSVEDIVPKAQGVSVTAHCKPGQEDAIAERRELTARLLVVADGAQSGLRSRLGIDADTTSYGQSAIIANVQTSLPHEGVAFERFTADGAVALLPLPDLADARQRSALVWTVPADKANELMQEVNNDECSSAFVEKLQQAFGHRLGKITRVGKCHSYPLSLTVSRELARSHIVIMGNAAHSLHPIAGQGFNLALRDIAMLVEYVVAAHKHGDDIGSLQTLESFVAEQESDQRMTIGFSHQLINLFGLQLLPVQAGRSLGLLALDIFKPAKHEFIKRAAGLAGRRPRLNP